MPPEVYDGPLWLQIVGAAAFAALVSIALLYGGWLVDRAAERRFNKWLRSEDGKASLYIVASEEAADD